MGVKGLSLILDQFNIQKAIEFQTIQSGSTLVIDANGFFFYLIKDYLKDIIFHIGDYGFIHSLVINEINKYLSRGITLIFYFDGQSQMKYKTAQKRSERIYKQWEYLNKICISSRALGSSYDALPIPVLAMQQFRDTLKSLNMNIIECDGEADQVIAMYCSDMNSYLPCKSERYYCLGSDRYTVYRTYTDFYIFILILFSSVSDFIAMKDCPYIQFGSIRFDDDGGLSACVWRREVTCLLLQISERQFVELCIYLGNDFTDVYDKALFNKPHNADLSVYALCGKALVDHMLSSADPELQRAIEFSRDFYELRDLTHYDYDAKVVYRSIYTLSEEQELKLHEVFNDNRALSMSELLHTCCPICPEITPEHAEALLLTTADLSNGGASTSGSSVDNSSVCDVSWDDVIAADFYQMVYKEWRGWAVRQELQADVEVR